MFLALFLAVFTHVNFILQGVRDKAETNVHHINFKLVEIRFSQPAPNLEEAICNVFHQAVSLPSSPDVLSESKDEANAAVRKPPGGQPHLVSSYPMCSCISGQEVTAELLQRLEALPQSILNMGYEQGSCCSAASDPYHTTAPQGSMYHPCNSTRLHAFQVQPAYDKSHSLRLSPCRHRSKDAAVQGSRQALLGEGHVAAPLPASGNKQFI